MRFIRRKALEDILHDEAFWALVRSEVMRVALPLFRDIFLQGAEVGADVRPVRQKAELTFDPDAINRAADEELARFTNQWWEQLDRTQREGLGHAIQLARQEGTGAPGVLDGITGLFDERRMMAIAVTETTRLFGLGALATYRAAGMDGWEWRTVGDARVDPLCEGEAGNQFPITTHFDPKHVGCRCFPVPVLNLATKAA